MTYKIKKTRIDRFPIVNLWCLNRRHQKIKIQAIKLKQGYHLDEDNSLFVIRDKMAFTLMRTDYRSEGQPIYDRTNRVGLTMMLKAGLLTTEEHVNLWVRKEKQPKGKDHAVKRTKRPGENRQLWIIGGRQGTWKWVTPINGTPQGIYKEGTRHYCVARIPIRGGYTGWTCARFCRIEVTL